jgi:hypothetical protein
MASQEQIEANRRNAQLSTGPKTPEGKAVVSRNPTRHGLASSRAIVLPEENGEEFQELLNGLQADYQPEGALEQCLVFQLAAAEWRLRRIARFETGLFIDRLDDLRGDLRLRRPAPEPDLSAADQQFDEHTRLLGRVFWRGCSGDAFVKLLRYENTARRAFYKALNELKLIQARRVGASPPENEK